MRKIQHIRVTFHVIILSEIWIADALEWIEIPGCSAYQGLRTRTSGGWVTVLVYSDLENNLNADLLINNKIFERVVEEVKINCVTYAVIGVYRPPSSSLPDFNINFFQLINSVSNSCIILYVFNIDIISNVRNVYGIDFLDKFLVLAMTHLSVFRRGKPQPQLVSIIFFI